SSGSVITVDTTQAPVLIDAATHTFRHWVRGTYDTGTVTLTFLAGSWVTTNLTTGEAVGNLETTLTVANPSTINTGYLDVTLRPTTGQTVVFDLVTGNELTLAPPAGSSAALAAVLPTRLPGTNTFRYYVTGDWTAGDAVVQFTADTWRDT